MSIDFKFVVHARWRSPPKNLNHMLDELETTWNANLGAYTNPTYRTKSWDTSKGQDRQGSWKFVVSADSSTTDPEAVFNSATAAVAARAREIIDDEGVNDLFAWYKDTNRIWTAV